MKRILLIFMVLLFAGTTFAQTQQGIVKTRGRVVNGQVMPGTKLSGATITLSVGNPQVSQAQGAFSFNVPSGKSYSLVSAKKQGYTLADPEYTRRTFKYSAGNPFYVVLEDEAQRQADIKEATDKVRKTLKRELRKREDELDELRESNAITQAKYDSLRMEFANYRQSSEALVNEMAQRFAAIDYDQLDEFNRQVQQYIEEGELLKADSLINTRGSVEERYARVKEQESVNTQREEEIRQQQESLSKSQELTQREKEDLMSDLYAKHTIYLQAYQQDSALYCLKMRADLDTTNVQAVWDYADLCYEQHNFEDAERYYKMSLKLYSFNNDSYNYASALNNLGLLYFDIHDYSNCENCYKLALEEYEKMSAEESTDVLLNIANAQLNLGNLYLSLDEYEKSEAQYQSSLRIYQNLATQNPESYLINLSMVQNSLGLLYEILHNYANSEQYYLLAIENKELLFKQNPDAYRKELAVTQNNIAGLYRNMHDYKNCVKYCELALENYNTLFCNNPNAYRGNLAMIQNNLGLSNSNLQEYSKSEEMYKKALENYTVLFNLYPDVYQVKVLGVQRNLAVLYSRQKDFVNAELYHRLALENVEELFEKAPNVYRKDIAMILNNMGYMYYESKDYENSKKYYMLAIGHKELLYLQSKSAFSESLAMSLYNLAYTNIALDNLSEAVRLVDRSIELVPTDPDNYDLKGEILLMQGRNDEALEMWKKVLELDPNFLDNYPDGTNLSNGLKKLGLIN